MMTGTVAQPLNRLGGGAGGGTLAHADFINGTYSVSGSPVTAADVVDQPGLIGASGLSIDSSSGTGTVEIIGGLLAALLTANWTIVLEIEAVNANQKLVPLALYNSTELDQFIIERFDNLSPENIMRATQINRNFDQRQATDMTIYGIGIHKLAITMSSTTLAMSVNGNAVVEQVAAAPVPYDPLAAFFGDFQSGAPTGTCFIRSLSVLDPVLSADLPALSA